MWEAIAARGEPLPNDAAVRAVFDSEYCPLFGSKCALDSEYYTVFGIQIGSLI